MLVLSPRLIDDSVLAPRIVTIHKILSVREGMLKRGKCLDLPVLAVQGAGCHRRLTQSRCYGCPTLSHGW